MSGEASGDEQDVQSVVIDNGSGLIKAGFTGEPRPSEMFPSVVGRSRLRNCHIGYDALRRRSHLDLQCPIENGIIVNWDEMQKIWEYCFNKLKVTPDQLPVLLTEVPFCPKSTREKMAQIMYETFQVPAMYVSWTSVLALYAAGDTTGLVVESGEGVTNIVPIVEGYPVIPAVIGLDVTGRDLSDYLIKILAERGYIFPTETKLEMAASVKKHLCYVALDFEMEKDTLFSSGSLMKAHQLPNGMVVDVDSQRFRCPEALFQPSLMGPGMDSFGIHDAITSSINLCDLSIRGKLYNNIIVSGGNTLFPGFSDRLCKEITAVVPSATKVKVNAPHNRLYSAWKGGSNLTMVPSFKEMWVQKSDYEESGAVVLHQKCI